MTKASSILYARISPDLMARVEAWIVAESTRRREAYQRGERPYEPRLSKQSGTEALLEAGLAAAAAPARASKRASKRTPAAAKRSRKAVRK